MKKYKTKRSGNSDTATIQFKDIDQPLRTNFIKIYISAVIFLIGGIAFGIFMKNTSLIFVTIICALSFAGVITFRIIKCMDGAVRMYEGQCIEIKSEKKKRNFIILEIDEENLLKIYVPNGSKFKIGNIIRMYAPAANISVLNNDTYTTNSFYYICVIKSNIKAPEETEVTEDDGTL